MALNKLLEGGSSGRQRVMVSPDVVVTGAMDLRGGALPVHGLHGKLQVRHLYVYDDSE